jgi:hypothetical protein
MLENLLTRRFQMQVMFALTISRSTTGTKVRSFQCDSRPEFVLQPRRRFSLRDLPASFPWVVVDLQLLKIVIGGHLYGFSQGRVIQRTVVFFFLFDGGNTSSAKKRLFHTRQGQEFGRQVRRDL